MYKRKNCLYDTQKSISFSGKKKYKYIFSKNKIQSPQIISQVISLLRLIKIYFTYLKDLSDFTFFLNFCTQCLVNVQSCLLLSPIIQLFSLQLFGFGLRRVVHDAMEAEIEQKHHHRRRRYQQHIFCFLVTINQCGYE